MLQTRETPSRKRSSNLINVIYIYIYRERERERERERGGGRGEREREGEDLFKVGITSILQLLFL